MSVLGPRQWYIYTSDNGNSYMFDGRAADNDAIGNIAGNENDHPPFPKRLHKRGVWTSAGPGTRRFFACGDPGNSFYHSGGSVSVDGDSWGVTGRKGEQQKGGVAA